MNCEIMKHDCLSLSLSLSLSLQERKKAESPNPLVFRVWIDLRRPRFPRSSLPHSYLLMDDE